MILALIVLADAGCAYRIVKREAPNALASWVPSKNSDLRGPQLIVLHATLQDSAQASLDTLRSRNAGGRVSAHYLVGRDGRIYQLVGENRRAWHAGGGSWGTIHDLNSASIGIELDNDGASEFPVAQIDALLVLLEDISKRQGIPRAFVIGHADLAPWRKSDPGPRFPWRRLAEAGFGRWPDAARMQESPPADFDGWLALRLLGYSMRDPQMALRAFRMHYRGIDDAAAPLGAQDARVLYALEPDALPRDSAEEGSTLRQATAALCGKRIALLGELPSHGEARAFRMKAQIVQALVRECGFDAVLFEAPMYDFIGFEQKRGGQAELDDAIGGFWSARELQAWRGWLREQALAGKLRVGGIDDQVSATSHHAEAVLPGLVAAGQPRRGAAGCRVAVTRHLAWSYDDSHPFDATEQRRLLDCARNAAKRTHGSKESLAMLASFAGYIARQVEPAIAPERDAAMFRNLSWHLARLPADAKVVVWTATVHASRVRGSLAFEPLGAQAAARWGRVVGAIGFTTRSGFSSMAGRAAVPLPFAAEGTLEARALGSNLDAVFVPRDALAGFGEVESRLFGKFSRLDWSTAFDGVVVIAEEKAPSFEP